MSVYHQFQKIEQVVDCSDFTKTLQDLIVYLKLTTDDAEVEYDSVFNWMGIVEDGNYDDYEIEEDIRSNGSWSEDDLNHIKKTVRELNGLMISILSDFEKKYWCKSLF